MRTTWNLPQPLPRARQWTQREVLLAFNGPQLTVLECDGESYLSVASDEDGTAIRWLRAPISAAEYRDLLSGAKTVRECILKAGLVVVDTDADGDAIREFEIEPDQLKEVDLPAVDSFLPDDIVASHHAAT